MQEYNVKDSLTAEYMMYRDRLQNTKLYRDCDNAFIDYQRGYALGNAIYKAGLMGDKEWMQERAVLMERYKKIENNLR